MKSLSRIAIILLGTVLLCSAAERFEMRYFYDEDDSALSLAQIQFPSSTRGIAIGSLSNGNRERGVVLLTSDAGAQWTMVELNDIPVALYCLDETACWMVAQKGIWFSAEGGRDWRKIHSEGGLRQIWFTNRQRGFAVGAQKKLIETKDGGKSWTKMPVLSKLEERSDRLTFSAITFITPKVGMILGRSEPLEARETVPMWLRTEPEYTREYPTLSVVMETRDGGESWNVSASSLFGRVSRLRPSARLNQALALVEFDRYFEVPSEIYLADLVKGTNERTLRRDDFAATDVALLRGGIALAAGFQPPGKLARTPVPGKVRVLRSGSDFKIWTDVPVDYRAVAHRVSIAVSPDNAVWLATDEGMILQLTPETRTPVRTTPPSVP